MVGEREFVQLAVDRDLPLLSLAFTVSWQANGTSDRRYTYRVAENLLSFNAEVSRFRQNLWGWLAGAAILLLLVQGAILRWSLAPAAARGRGCTRHRDRHRTTPEWVTTRASCAI